eukprot:s2333_g18.t1
MVSNMMPEDVPPDIWLRDALYKKIRNSHALMFDIKQYESWLENDPRKTINIYLIASKDTLQEYEKTNMLQQERSMLVTLLVRVNLGHRLLQLQTPKLMPKRSQKRKPRRKLRLLRKQKLRLKLLRYYLHHNRSNTQREKEKVRSVESRSLEVPVFDASKAGGQGKGKGNGKNSRSQSPANKPKKVDEPCWHWAKGKCRYGDKCNRRHDPHLFNTAPNANASSSTATPALLHDDSDDETPVFKIATNQVKKRVTFNMKANELCIYEKMDFVKCTKTSQTGSKAHGKVGKSTEEIRKDDHWTYSCRLAASRGKALAIIMDERGDYSDIDEVLIIVGPTLDIKIKMEMDDDDPVKEVFVENYVQHVVGRYGKRGNIMCITVPVEERDKKFIMDSGSGHDLISIKKVDRMDLSTYDDDVLNFHTANGVTSTTKRSDIDFKAFDEPAQMHVLDDTPSDYIPYVNLDQEKKTGNKKKVERILEIISDECSTSEGESMLVIDGESGDELEDLTDTVSNPKGISPKKKKLVKKKKKKYRRHHEAAVGSDVEEAEHDEDDIDDYDEFDDEGERGYSPSVGPDVGDDIDHDIEIEEEHEGDRNVSTRKMEVFD